MLEPEPKPEQEPEPKVEDPRARKLHELYHEVGQLIALESARKAPKIVIDGDIVVAWPDSVKQQIAERITTKLSKAAELIQEFQSDERMD